MYDVNVLREFLTYHGGDLYWKKDCRPRGKAGNIAGWKDKDGRKYFSILGKRYRVSRAIWEMEVGPVGDYVIDQINGDNSDNRIENLRICSQLDNCKNKKKRIDNTTGISSVFEKKDGRAKKYFVTIGDKYFGSFYSIDEAVAVRNAKKIELGYSERDGK
jgi:hypothetical protein